MERESLGAQGNGKVCEFMHCKVVLLRREQVKVKVDEFMQL